jgi:hypothetical protein
MPEITPTQAALDEALDEVLLDVIRNGRIVLDKHGDPVLGDDGKPMRVPPSAADLSVVVRRLHSLGISRLARPGGSAEELAREVGLEAEDVLEFPKIADDPEEQVG